ncbi:MAG: glycosyl hydrolase, partial [Victivallales bacterium]
VLDYVDEIGVVGYRITITLTDKQGTKAKTAQYILPETMGQWQRLRYPFNSRWALPLDRTKVVGMEMELSALKDHPVEFELAGLGLYRDPAYAGPSLKIDIRPMHLLVTPDEAFCFTCVVRGVPKGEPYELRFDGKDFFGNVETKTRSLTSTSNEFNFCNANFPNHGQGHLTITATLSQNGKDLYRVEWLMGSLPDLSGEQLAPNSKLPWGFWPGAGPDAVAAGAKWTRLRIDPPWFTNPEQHKQNASPVDNGEWRFIQKVPHGLQGIVCWFSSIPKECGNDKGREWWNAKIDWEAYGRLVEKMVRHCKEMGVRHFEVLNEPNAWPGPKTPELVKLHEVVYKAVKKVDPDAIVMGPSPYCLDIDYVEKFLEAGGKNFVDAVSMHAYNREDELKSKIAELRQVMTKHGLEGHDIYITEMGCNAPPHSLQQQARAAVRSNIVLFSQGVKAVTWHGLSEWGMEPPDASVKRDLAFTMMQFNGEPAPGFIAYGVMTRTLGNAKYIGPVGGLPEHCAGESFRSGNKTVSILWNRRSKPETASIPVNGKT